MAMAALTPLQQPWQCKEIYTEIGVTFTEIQGNIHGNCGDTRKYTLVLTAAPAVVYVDIREKPLFVRWMAWE